MKKGFTLVELLAVIVILAIIALIATPIVLNIINSARESAKLKSAEYYIDAVNQAVVRERMNGIKINTTTCNINSNGYLNCEGIDKEVRIDTEGDMPVSGIIVIENGLVKKNSDTYIVFSDEKRIGFDIDGKLLILDSPFATDSWETIVNNVKKGNTSKYRVGEKKEITLTSTDSNITGTYTVRIANTSTPAECNNSNFSQTACGFVIEFVDIITEQQMNLTGTNVGGWRDSLMRNYVNNDIYNAFPSILKNNIIDTTVVSGHGSSDASNFITIDKLYLLSIKEIWENVSSDMISNDTARETTRQLDYYKRIETTIGDSLKLIKTYNGENFAWSLRTPRSKDAINFYCMNSKGNWGHPAAVYSEGVAPAFRIG